MVRHGTCRYICIACDSMFQCLKIEIIHRLDNLWLECLICCYIFIEHALFSACWSLASASSRAELPLWVIGTGPGFSGGINGTSDRVSYVARDTVRKRSSNWPSPKFEWMEDASALSSTRIWRIVANEGIPSIAVSVGCGN